MTRLRAGKQSRRVVMSPRLGLSPPDRELSCWPTKSGELLKPALTVGFSAFGLVHLQANVRLPPRHFKKAFRRPAFTATKFYW